MPTIDDLIEHMISEKVEEMDVAEQGHLDDLEQQMKQNIEEREEALQQQIDQLKELLEDQLKINEGVMDQFKEKVCVEVEWVQALIIRELPGACVKLLRKFIGRVEGSDGESS